MNVPDFIANNVDLQDTLMDIDMVLCSPLVKDRKLMIGSV